MPLRPLVNDPNIKATEVPWHSIMSPNAIHAHGLLFVLHPETLVFLRISENLVEVMARSAEDMLGKPLWQLFGQDFEVKVRAALEHPRIEQANPLEVRFSVFTERLIFEAVLSRVQDQDLNTVVVELTVQAEDNGTQMSYFYDTFRRAMDQLPPIDNLSDLVQVAALEMRHLTGFDRVMVYQFAPDWHGKVIAESCDPGQEKYLHLHFPATDIPSSSRHVYYKNRTRMIADVDNGYCFVASLPALSVQWDMSACLLRATHPGHLQYLRNMGSGATFTVSLMVNDELWGLIACHHVSPKLLPYHVRSAAELFGRLFSLQLQNLQAKHHLEALTNSSKRSLALITQASSAPNFVAALLTTDLLELVAADGAVVQLEGEYRTIGQLPPQAAILALVKQLFAATDAPQFRNNQALKAIVSHQATEDFGLDDALRGIASGVLFLPLSRSQEDFVLWFRGEILQEISWAGQPPSPGEVQTPRASFAAWQEQVRGKSLRWSEADLAAVQQLSLSIPEWLLRRAQSKLAHFALHDALTGLPNRVYLNQIHQPRINENWRGVVMFIDFDRFKLVNDSLGHEAGDVVLRELAARLARTLESPENAVRLGGDEFVVIETNLSLAAGLQLAQQIAEQFRQPLIIGQTEYFLSASIGIAASDGQMQFEELLRCADAAMYRAKADGRNTIVVYDPERTPNQARVAELEQALHRAVERKEFSLVYQPILTPNGDLIGAEALLRWQHPVLGSVSPNEFIPIAESSNIIYGLGAWVLEQAFIQAAQWIAEYPEWTDFRISVNLSVKQLSTPDIVRLIEETSRKTGVAPSRIKLEVTETSLMENPELSAQLLTQLRDKGFLISIDDFGTGFSSLAYVQHLPIHELKIDRSFTRHITTSHRDLALVASIINLAHELGILAIIEGVETEAQRLALLKVGCDALQGYLFSRPVPPEQFPGW